MMPAILSRSACVPSGTATRGRAQALKQRGRGAEVRALQSRKGIVQIQVTRVAGHGEDGEGSGDDEPATTSRLPRGAVIEQDEVGTQNERERHCGGFAATQPRLRGGRQGVGMDRDPGRERQPPSADEGWRSRVRQLVTNGSGQMNRAEEFRQHVMTVDQNQIAERRGIRENDHAASDVAGAGVGNE